MYNVFFNMKITVSCNNWVLVNITQVIAYMK